MSDRGCISNRRKRMRSRAVRRSYMMDERTLRDLELIQTEIRAASASEALRRIIRQCAMQLTSLRVESPPLQIDTQNLQNL